MESDSIIFKINLTSEEFSANHKFMGVNLQSFIVSNKEVHLIIQDKADFDVTTKGYIDLSNFINEGLT